MNGALHALRAASTGRSETVNGYTGGISLIILSLIASAVPVSKLPQVPFIDYMMNIFYFLVLSAIAAGCVLLVKATFRLAQGRIFPLLLFSLAAMVSGLVTYGVGYFSRNAYGAAVATSPFSPETLAAISLLVAALYVVAVATMLAFAGMSTHDTVSPPGSRLWHR